jgi:hypothetical protein
LQLVTCKLIRGLTAVSDELLVDGERGGGAGIPHRDSFTPPIDPDSKVRGHESDITLCVKLSGPSFSVSFFTIGVRRLA